MLNMSHRLRELAVQAANATLTDDDRAALDLEHNQIAAEIEAISTIESPLMSGGRLFSGANGEIAIQISDDEYLDINALGTGNQKIFDNVSAGTGLVVTPLNVNTQAIGQNTLTLMENSIIFANPLKDRLGNIGAMQNQLSSISQNLDVEYENLMQTKSRIRDVDVASETTQMVNSQIKQQASVSIMAQANQQTQIALQLMGAR